MEYFYEAKGLDSEIISFMQELDLNTRSLGRDNIRVLLDFNRVILACAFVQYGEDFSEVFVFGVRSTHQRQGVGKFFANKIISELKETGCNEIGVEPNSLNAYMFWTRVGFSPIPYADGNYGYPKLIMKLN